MATYLQADRPMTVTTPLGPDVLLLRGFSGKEALSQLFHFQLELLAENGTEVPFDQLLGQKFRVDLSLPVRKTRHISGICSRIAEGGRDSTFTYYRMEMVPQHWLLTHKAQSRIFQHVTVPDILKKVFEGLDVTFDLEGTYHPRDFCVQYRETDFQFASRLMEEEGIFYFFQHSADGHRMVVADTPQGHPDLPEQCVVDFEHGEVVDHQADQVTEWEKAQELRPGKVTLWDHCFELPHKHLEAEKIIQDSASAGEVSHKLRIKHNEKLEIYDYPGAYAQRFDGVDPGGGDRAGDLKKIFADNRRTVEIRMQEEAVPGLTIRGAGHCRYLIAGHKFTLDRHFNANGSYVLTAVEHNARTSLDYRSGMGGEFRYENRFTCMPAAVPFRPSRSTPKPTVNGTQTAVVVGPPGEEIFTDKYGRIKVQFHWDREGKYDSNSSCWVRVGTSWAGKQWGAIHIPRIGQEVIVAFEEGEPDRPIIVGSVYNADQMPPFALPGGKVVCGAKSNSTPGGGGYNEFVLDDTKGNELIRVHGQYDMDSTIEHDLREHVLNNRTRDVTVDETLTIGNDQAYTIGSNQTGTVGVDKTLQVGANHTETIGANMTVSVGSNLTETVGICYTETVGAAYILSVGAVMTQSIGAAYILTVGSSMKETVGGKKGVMIGSNLVEKVGGKQTTQVGGNLLEKVGGKYSETVAGAYSLKAKTILLDAQNSITLKTGGASITMKSSGTIVIKGMKITSEASAKNLVKGAMVNSEADAINTIKGSLVKIN